MSDILAAIKNAHSYDDGECDVTFEELAGAVSRLLDKVILSDEAECERLCDWEDKIRESACDVLGGHHWISDQCGYWGHDLCSRCQVKKYPDLAGQRCHAIGKVTEAEYLKQLEDGDDA